MPFLAELRSNRPELVTVERSPEATKALLPLVVLRALAPQRQSEATDPRPQAEARFSRCARAKVHARARWPPLCLLRSPRSFASRAATSTCALSFRQARLVVFDAVISMF